MEQLFKLEEWRKKFEIPIPYLVDREDGKKFYKPMLAALKAIPSESTLIIDFSDLTVVDTSFADETVLRLLKELTEGQYGERFLCLFNPSESTVANLQGAIARKRLRLAFFAIFHNRKWRCIGRYDSEEFPDEQIEPLLQQTLELVLKRGKLTARELASIDKIELNNASTRLKKLHDVRLVKREEIISDEGKSYAYKPVAELRQ